MGCTPSKSAGIYSQDMVCPELETCSTYVPQPMSSVSTPEKPRSSVETGSGRQAFLNVPCRDVQGPSVSQSPFLDHWSSAGSTCRPNEFSVKPRSPTPDLRGASGCCGTT